MILKTFIFKFMRSSNHLREQKDACQGLWESQYDTETISKFQKAHLTGTGVMRDLRVHHAKVVHLSTGLAHS